MSLMMLILFMKMMTIMLTMLMMMVVMGVVVVVMTILMRMRMAMAMALVMVMALAVALIMTSILMSFMFCDVIPNLQTFFSSFEGHILAGPITIKKPKPLPAELQSYINGSESEGFIIVSFGSYVETLMTKDKIDIMAAAFGKLKQKVLWKLKSTKINYMYKA